MAIEYEFEATPVLNAKAMLDYFADLLGCDTRYEEYGEEPARAVKREVQLIALDWPPSEVPPLADLLDVDRTVSITFRMNKFLTREENGTIFRDILAAAAKFLEDHPGSKAVFSFQYEDIYLQRLGEDETMLSEELRRPGFNIDGVLDELLAKYPTRELGSLADLIPDD